MFNLVSALATSGSEKESEGISLATVMKLVVLWSSADLTAINNTVYQWGVLLL